jgi:hypothetical protein
VVDTRAAGRSLEELRSVLDRAQRGDESAAPEVRWLLAAAGAADAAGWNLADRASRALLAAFAGGNLLAREAVCRKMDELRAELGGPSPSPVERLLAERAVCCWLHLYHLEHAYGSKASMSFELAAHYQRSIDRAHRRYLSALKALAEVRRLAGPTVQVNIARKQVNVAGGTPTS